jgi:predicted permease
MVSLALHLLRDVQYGLRRLRRTPAFALGALVTVALTVGATSAIYSVVHGILLRQLPYREVNGLFWIWSDQPGRDRTPFNVPDFIDYRDSARMLSGVAGFFAFSANLSDESTAERVQGIRASGNLFDVLGAQSRFGRLLQASDERAGADPVVVLAEPFWSRRFGGDPAIVGSTIRLNGDPYTVVGVIAAGFTLPILDVDFVLPYAADLDVRRNARNSVNFIHGVGRLAPGASLPEAASELTAIARRLQRQFPVENARKRGVRMVAVLDGIVGPFRAALWTLLAGVGVVLLIACANLANLMLTRAAGGRKEVAVQLALGSTCANVVRQVLVEALLVAFAGGLLGVLIARWGVVAVVALASAALPRVAEIRIDLAVLLFSFAAAAITGALFGVMPALVSARVDVREALQSSSRGATAGGHRLRGLLVTSEVTLAVVLLVVMTMLAKSFAKVQAIEPGFDPQGVLTARLTLPAKRFNNTEAIVGFQRGLAERLSSLPAVTHAAAISLLPLSGLLARVPFTVEGRPVERERVPLAQYRTVAPGYFAAMGIPLKRGRIFTDHDTEKSIPVAIVSEELARRWLEGLDPIGARLLVDDNDSAPRPIEVIGVVGNVQQVALDGQPTLDLYLTYPQTHPDNIGAAASNMFWVVRTTAEPTSIASMLAKVLGQIDRDVAASQVWPMERYLANAAAPRRFSVSLMAAFAIAALALAITGIYAVVAYSVSQRTREIGIRVALGATRASIVRLVVGQGLRPVIAGLAIGTVLAGFAAQLIATMLFELSPSDTATFGQVGVTVGAASVLACALPAWRLGRALPGLPKND